VVRVPKDEQNFEKLIKGRIDIFPQDLDVGYEMIHKLFPKEQWEMFAHHPKPIKNDSFHVLLSKKVERNKQMLELFNRGLEKLKQSGKIEQYLEASRNGAYRLSEK
jgi:polar amino acid transport system substrate-binding protein